MCRIFIFLSKINVEVSTKKLMLNDEVLAFFCPLKPIIKSLESFKYNKSNLMKLLDKISGVVKKDVDKVITII